MIHDVENVINTMSYDKGDWKLNITVNTTNDAKATRVFLQHNGFKEFPVKLSCHTYQHKQFFVTVLPLLEEKPRHVQYEVVKHDASLAYNQHTYHLQCVDEVDESRMIVPIDSSKIQAGSIFVHDKLSVVATLVQTLHEETFSTNNQNRVVTPSSKPILTLIVSWPAKSSSATIKQKVHELEQLLNWFDF